VPAQVNLRIAEDGADPQRLDEVTGMLRRELLDLDVEDVRRSTAGPAPDGSRALDAATVGALVVTLGQTATGLAPGVAAVRAWLSRGGGVRRTVKIEIDGDTLELSEVSAAQQDRLVDLFVGRHGGTR
jgi:hypothetical protein